MKKYVIIIKDKKGSASEELVHAHVEHLRELARQDILVLCGPLKDSDKGMKIVQVNSFDEAKAIALNDPFTEEKYYTAYELYELEEANESNNFLLD